MSKAIYEWAKGTDDYFMVLKTEHNSTRTAAIVDTEEQAKAVVAALIASTPARKEGWYRLRNKLTGAHYAWRFINNEWCNADGARYSFDEADYDITFLAPLQEGDFK